MPYQPCVFSKLDIWKVNVMQHHFKYFSFLAFGRITTDLFFLLKKKVELEKVTQNQMS